MCPIEDTFPVTQSLYNKLNRSLNSPCRKKKGWGFESKTNVGIKLTKITAPVHGERVGLSEKGTQGEDRENV
jgi:hypothetical protein